MNYNIDYVELYEKEKRRNISKTFSRFMLSLFLYTAVAYAVIFIAELLMVLTLGADKTSSLFYDNIYFEWFISTAPMYLVALPLLFFMTKGMKSSVREKRKLKFKDFAALLLICQAITLVGGLIGSVINGILGTILNKDIGSGTMDLIERSPIWLIFLVAVIIGPIIEEFIFRKLLIDRIGKYGDLTAILTSGIAFGLFHGNFEQFFYATMLGMLFAFVYTKTGNWIHTALLHIAVNFLGSIVTIPVIRATERIDGVSDPTLAENMLQYTRDTLLVTSYSILNYAAVAAGIFILVGAIRKKKIQITNNSEIFISSGELFQRAVFNVGTILFLLGSILQFFVNIFLS